MLRVSVGAPPETHRRCRVVSRWGYLHEAQFRLECDVLNHPDLGLAVPSQQPDQTVVPGEQHLACIPHLKPRLGRGSLRPELLAMMPWVHGWVPDLHGRVLCTAVKQYLGYAALTVVLWRCGVGQGARVLPELHACRENGLLVVLLHILDCTGCAEVEACTLEPQRSMPRSRLVCLCKYWCVLVQSTLNWRRGMTCPFRSGSLDGQRPR